MVRHIKFSRADKNVRPAPPSQNTLDNLYALNVRDSAINDPLVKRFRTFRNHRISNHSHLSPRIKSDGERRNFQNSAAVFSKTILKRICSRISTLRGERKISADRGTEQKKINRTPAQ